MWYAACLATEYTNCHVRRDVVNSKHGPDAQNSQPQAGSVTHRPDEARHNRLSVQSRLASDERDAALRALAGRLAHQIRNPLSAVRAACSGLLAEIDHPEQRETLELSLGEIDRVLSFVTATVKTMAEHVEQPVNIDLGAELADVIAVAQMANAGPARVRLDETGALPCRMPRDGLRAALYSLVEHLTQATHTEAVVVDLAQRDDQALISFAVTGADLGGDNLTTGMMSPTAWVQPVGLLVAERFARGFGGRLTRKDSGDNRLEFVLELPIHV